MRRAWALAVLLAAGGCAGSLPPIDRVILLTLDTTRADRLGCYGYEGASTPHLDGLAEEGVVFEQAVSAVPTTLPAHSTILTGLYPPDHKVRYNIFYNLSDTAETLPEVLQSRGWKTAAFPASHIIGEKFGLNQGFDHWSEPPERDPSRTDSGHPAETHRPAEDGVDLAIDWIEQQGDDRLFAWLHFYDPHWPYTPPFPYKDRFRDRPYDGEIAYMDAQVGRLLNVLRNDPAWDRTLVIAVADHGEGLFDHNEQFHAILVYESTQRVPLIIRAPGVRARRVAEPVSQVDLMPTILDLVGIEYEKELRGRSLRDGLTRGEVERRDVYFESLAGAIVYGWAELRGLRFGDWKLIDSRTPELFNLAADAGELENRVSRDVDRIDDMTQELARMAEGIGSIESGSVQLSPEEEERLRSLGYVEGSVSEQKDPDAADPREMIDMHEEILAAQTAMAQRRFRRVLEVTSYVLGRDPNNKWALGTSANALMATGRAAQALAPAERALDRSPESDQAHLLVARVHNQLGNSTAALAALDRGLEQLPESELLLYYQLVASFDAEVADVCTRRVPEALTPGKDRPDDDGDGLWDSWRLLLLQARCDMRADDHDLAMERLERAVDHGLSRAERLADGTEFAALEGREDFRALVERSQAKTAETDAGVASAGAP